MCPNLCSFQKINDKNALVCSLRFLLPASENGRCLTNLIICIVLNDSVKWFCGFDEGPLMKDLQQWESATLLKCYILSSKVIKKMMTERFKLKKTRTQSLFK